MKRTYKPLLVTVLGCALFYGGTAAGSTVDWTPLLESWEDGCAQSEEWGQLRRNLVTYPEGSLYPEVNEIVLPDAYKESLGEIELFERNSDYSGYRLAAKNGEYYGLPVESFVFYLGNSNGISVLLIEFSAPIADVQERLSNIEYTLVSHDSGSYQAQLMTDEEADKAMLMCDLSV
ncbi:hypothetical protein M0220_14110 [Halomonas qinghailakensis]|uniref:Uncharacterized protein n=1 Tax=Halomonas qinghailakensis TaxID=2937790 RepID=A0AA46TR27_9GAMM|nr:MULTISPECIES: hypothetical protein [Halomonas]UYO73997.1 hypothetical protein M0220_14110 [Halomonas sp. ZZQ-149]